MSVRAFTGVYGREETHAAYPVVFVVVLWLLDHVPPYDRLVAMIIVGLVGREVDLSQKLLLVMLEFSNHRNGFSCCDRYVTVKVQRCRSLEKILVGPLQSTLVARNPPARKIPTPRRIKIS